jgi:hypothetical protein
MAAELGLEARCVTLGRHVRSMGGLLDGLHFLEVVRMEDEPASVTSVRDHAIGGLELLRGSDYDEPKTDQIIKGIMRCWLTMAIIARYASPSANDKVDDLLDGHPALERWETAMELDSGLKAVNQIATRAGVESYAQSMFLPEKDMATDTPTVSLAQPIVTVHTGGGRLSRLFKQMTKGQMQNALHTIKCSPTLELTHSGFLDACSFYPDLQTEFQMYIREMAGKAGWDKDNQSEHVVDFIQLREEELGPEEIYLSAVQDALEFKMGAGQLSTEYVSQLKSKMGSAIMLGEKVGSVSPMLSTQKERCRLCVEGLSPKLRKEVRKYIAYKCQDMRKTAKGESEPRFFQKEFTDWTDMRKVIVELARVIGVDQSESIHDFFGEAACHETKKKRMPEVRTVIDGNRRDQERQSHSGHRDIDVDPKDQRKMPMQCWMLKGVTGFFDGDGKNMPPMTPINEANHCVYFYHKMKCPRSMCKIQVECARQQHTVDDASVSSNSSAIEVLRAQLAQRDKRIHKLEGMKAKEKASEEAESELSEDGDDADSFDIDN